MLQASAIRSLAARCGKAFRQSVFPKNPERQAALERSEAQRLARVGNWQWEPEADVFHWSSTLTEFLGRDPGAPDSTFEQQRSLFAKESFERLAAAVQTTAQHGTAFELELEISPRSGERRWISARGAAVRNARHRIVAVHGTAYDITQRRAAEQALLEKEQRFRGIFDSMFQMIAVLSTDGTLLEINQTALAFFGIEAADVIGKRAWGANWRNAHPHNRQQFEDAFARAVAGEFVRYDVEFSGAAGHVVTVDFSLKPIFDADGRVTMLVNEARDVTEDRKTLVALAESESRFRLAMRNAPIGKAIVALDGRFIAVNASLCAMLGYSESALLLLNFQQLTHPDDLATDMDLLHGLLAGKHDRYHMSKRYIHSDGHLVDAELNVSLLRNAAGAPIHFISQIQDISERRHLEREQEALTKRLKLALRVSGIGVWDLDVGSGVFEIDDALYRIYGLQRDDVTDYAAWRDAVVAEDFPRAEAAIAAAIQQKASQAVEFRIRHPKLGIRFIESAFGVMLDDSQEVVRIVGVNMDVTERWEAERRMSESRALLRNLIDNLPMWVSMVDRKGQFVVTNRRNAKTLGLPVADIEGRDYRKLLSPSLLSRTTPAWESALAGHTVEASDRFVEDGRLTHVQGIVLPITEGPQTGNALGVFSDVSALKQAELQLSEANQRLENRIAEVLQLQELLREQVTRDGLTGLYNRRYFDDVLSGELDQARQQSYDLSLIIADLDHFKRLNDRFGHQSGDALLQAWSELLRQSLRSGDIACRYGGEEFAIVLPRCPLESALKLADQLRSGLASLKLANEVAGKEVSTTVSIGVAHSMAGNRSPRDLIRAADTALYRAKSLGRNRVECESTDPSGGNAVIAIEGLRSQQQ